MKKWMNFSLWFILVLLLASCQNEDKFVSSDNLPVKEPRKVMINRQVSMEQAKAFANIMANNLFSTEDGPKVRSTTADEEREIEEIQRM